MWDIFLKSIKSTTANKGVHVFPALVERKGNVAAVTSHHKAGDTYRNHSPLLLGVWTTSVRIVYIFFLSCCFSHSLTRHQEPPSWALTPVVFYQLQSSLDLMRVWDYCHGLSSKTANWHLVFVINNKLAHDLQTNKCTNKQIKSTVTCYLTLSLKEQVKVEWLLLTVQKVQAVARQWTTNYSCALQF